MQDFIDFYIKLMKIIFPIYVDIYKIVINNNLYQMLAESLTDYFKVMVSIFR